MRSRTTVVTCPRCRNTMNLVIESESSGGVRRITYLYICPVCRYRITQEETSVKLNGGKIELRRRVYVSKLH